MKHTFDVDINSEAFESLRNDINSALYSIIGKMEETEVENAEVSLKLNIGFNKLDLVELGGVREITVPTFDHKVTTKIQLKSEAKGSLAGYFELKFDGNKYYLQEIKADANQTSMFEE